MAASEIWKVSKAKNTRVGIKPGDALPDFWVEEVNAGAESFSGKAVCAWKFKKVIWLCDRGEDRYLSVTVTREEGGSKGTMRTFENLQIIEAVSFFQGKSYM